MPEDETPEVEELANRLRLIQIDLADESAQVRCDYLEDELQNAVKQLAPAQRPAFLEALAERFPTWEQPTDSEPAPAPEPAPDTAAWNDPAELVEQLVALAPSLSEEQRQALGRQLDQAGLRGHAPEGGWPEEATDGLRRAVGAEEGESLDSERTLELASRLIELFGRVDQLVFSTWREIAPRSELRRNKPLTRVLHQYATGDRNVDQGVLAGELERTRKLTAAMVASVGHIGRQFFHQWLSRLAPSEIQALVDAEGGSPFTAKGVKCWQKYNALMADFDEATVDREIKQIIARYAESLMTGVDR